MNFQSWAVRVFLPPNSQKEKNYDQSGQFRRLPSPFLGVSGAAFVRLANHRPGEEGQTTSDYITVLIDSALDFDPRLIRVGRLRRVLGRIVGRDIVEPLKSFAIILYLLIMLPVGVV
jgi:hypothetical protein